MVLVVDRVLIGETKMPRKLLRGYLFVGCVVVVALMDWTNGAPMEKSLRKELNPSYIRAMAAYRRLEPKLAREDLQAITTIGLLNGAKRTEERMQQHLVDNVKDLVLNTDMNNTDNAMPKIEKIERQLSRDQHALNILTSAMDIMTRTKSIAEFKRDMDNSLSRFRQSIVNSESSSSSKEEDLSVAVTTSDNHRKNELFAERVAELRRNILNHVAAMKSMVEEKIEQTLNYMIADAHDGGLLARASHKVIRKRATGNQKKAKNGNAEEPTEIRMLKSILSEVDDFRLNLVDSNGSAGKRERKDSKVESLEDLSLEGDKSVNATRKDENTPSRQETTGGSNEADEAVAGDGDGEGGGASGGGGGGGLTGLIASLSGGEGGSDIGALLGAVTGVVSTLFGPGGLDVESLISSGTSLIAGLLSGNKNFGTVLGGYVGLALDGLSGGGGAINNGQFVGNFLGTVLASLSADPEDDDEPAKPLLFVQNLISSFIEAKNRKDAAEDSEDSNTMKGSGGSGAGTGGGGGSDSGSFVKQIVSHLVSKAISVILNASLGASGGASHGSSSIFAGSSGAHHKPAPTFK